MIFTTASCRLGSLKTAIALSGLFKYTIIENLLFQVRVICGTAVQHCIMGNKASE